MYLLYQWIWWFRLFHENSVTKEYGNFFFFFWVFLFFNFTTLLIQFLENGSRCHKVLWSHSPLLHHSFPISIFSIVWVSHIYLSVHSLIVGLSCSTFLVTITTNWSIWTSMCVNDDTRYSFSSLEYCNCEWHCGSCGESSLVLLRNCKITAK